MKISRTPIIPVKQAMVRIAGYDILAICMADGNTAAGFRMICVLLGVDYMGQIRKLQVDPAFRNCLILAKVEIAGKQRVARFIIAEFIPLWLKGIHPSKVAPEARETLEELRSVAVDALRAFFFPETKAQQSAPPKQEPAQALPPKEEAQQSAPPPEEDEMAYWEDMAGGFIGLEKQIRALVASQKRTEALMVQFKHHLNEHAKGLNQHAEVLRRHETWIGYFDEQLQALTALVNRLVTPGSLTAEHQGELRVMLRGAAHQAGQPISAIEHELAAAFGVETISQLPEARWGEVAAWFHQRLGW